MSASGVQLASIDSALGLDFRVAPEPGKTLRLTIVPRWSYYYAHLNAYAPGLREGQRIERGSPIGTVGATGNANPTGPHLHFAIYRMEPGQRWHDGTPINPYPLLAGKPVNR